MEGYLYACEQCLVVSAFTKYLGLHKVLMCPACKISMVHEVVNVKSIDTTTPAIDNND